LLHAGFQCSTDNIFDYICLNCVVAAKYPEIKHLMGHDPRLKYIVTAMVFVQIVSAYLLRDASWVTIAIAGYMWGGVINHSMTLAIHEISHNLAFSSKRPWANRALGMFGNLIIGIPYSTVFRKYHQVLWQCFSKDKNSVE